MGTAGPAHGRVAHAHCAAGAAAGQAEPGGVVQATCRAMRGERLSASCGRTAPVAGCAQKALEVRIAQGSSGTSSATSRSGIGNSNALGKSRDGPGTNLRRWPEVLGFGARAVALC